MSFSLRLSKRKNENHSSPHPHILCRRWDHRHSAIQVKDQAESSDCPRCNHYAHEMRIVEFGAFPLNSTIRAQMARVGTGSPCKRTDKTLCAPHRCWFLTI